MYIKLENAVGTWMAGKCFHSFFHIVPNFHKCLHTNLIKTRMQEEERNNASLFQIIFA